MAIEPEPDQNLESYRFPLPDPLPFKAGFDTYLSPYTFRYGSAPMRAIWSQHRHWSEVSRFWLIMAEVQSEMGLVSSAEVDDLRKNIALGPVSVERVFQIERDRKIGTGHDYNAAARELSERAPIGGKKAGQGGTSEDPGSNVEIQAVQESLKHVRGELVNTIDGFGSRIDEHKNTICVGATHLQVAEPTVYGYRWARTAQDLLDDLQFLDAVTPLIRGKGVKGAVGTLAASTTLLKGKDMTPDEYDKEVMKRYGIEPVTISDQTYPRKYLMLAVEPLMNIGQSLHKFALDVQVLQSSWIDEISEPRNETQLGSFAMPHKQNPVNSENVDSLTETLPGIMTSAWITAAFVTLERTLRDSAGKRSWLPEAFLLIDESLMRTDRVIRGLRVHQNAVDRNMRTFAPYFANEDLLARMGQAGMDRKAAHNILHEHSLAAREEVRYGKPNPLRNLVLADERIIGLIGVVQVEQAFEDAFHHVGDAPERCERFLREELYPAIGKTYGS